MTYAEQQVPVLVKKLAEAELEVKRLNLAVGLEGAAHREAARHRDELLVEVYEMTALVEQLQIAVGNVTTAHAEILRSVEGRSVDPVLSAAIANLTAAVRGHFIDD